MNLRIRRKARGWTQAQLAEQLGVRRETVARYETGARRLDSAKLLALSRLLGCTVDELLQEDRDTSISQKDGV